jgi:deoxyribodipyrimidine photo-lyase
MNIFIFRRDLRTQDNIGLLHLIKDIPRTEKVTPIFIFNKKQIDPTINSYYSKNCVEFMVQSLHSLHTDTNVQFFETDDDIKVLKELQQQTGGIKRIYFNIDFTPFAIKRDETIIEWCNAHNVICKTFEDYTLLPLNTLTTGAGTYFSVFTPFYRKFIANIDMVPQVRNVSSIKSKMYSGSYLGTVHPENINVYYDKQNNDNLFVKGGRENALKILKKIKAKIYFENYDKDRDYPSLDGTTRLSAYLKFGCVSIREVFDALRGTYGLHHGLIRELIWRDFYANCLFNKPRVLNGQIDTSKGNLAFKEKYDSIKWETNKEWFKRWCEGNTGVPLVDAAMRQLNTTGWMHNRCRMIVACFLVKDMLLDWREGERYFATQLVDYDPSSNNGGWQFCSSTGVDAQPYFRIFNPYTQSQKFDIDTKYIKQWVPELADLSAKDIHRWDTVHPNYKEKTSYPAPMLDHSSQSKKAKELYKKWVG